MSMSTTTAASIITLLTCMLAIPSWSGPCPSVEKRLEQQLSANQRDINKLNRDLKRLDQNEQILNRQIVSLKKTIKAQERKIDKYKQTLRRWRNDLEGRL